MSLESEMTKESVLLTGVVAVIGYKNVKDVSKVIGLFVRA